jgi:hypothetical protein
MAAFPDLLAQFVQFEQPGFEVNCRVGDGCKGLGQNGKAPLKRTHLKPHNHRAQNF